MGVEVERSSSKMEILGSQRQPKDSMGTSRQVRGGTAPGDGKGI